MTMKNNEKISDKVRLAMGDKMVNQNPFISSDMFVGLISVVAQLPSKILRHTSNSGEGTNAVLSIVVTFLKNIPDGIWKLMKKAVFENGTDESRAMFDHLDALRGYVPKLGYAGEIDQEDENIPTFTTNPPTKPQ